MEIERPAAGDRVTATRTGKIVVGRYTGIVTLANTDWLRPLVHAQRRHRRRRRRCSWIVISTRTTAGRRLLRIHELGHALGYQHVKSRTSIMNPAIGPDATDFDRAGAIVAFQRQPGTVRPMSIRPVGSGCRAPPKAGDWSEPTVCR